MWLRDKGGFKRGFGVRDCCGRDVPVERLEDEGDERTFLVCEISAINLSPPTATTSINP